jgi:predicted AlkP superfamily pyrophosphatase or phosphodiesterase
MLTLFALVCGWPTFAARPAFADPPRLVVILAVDQMRADYVDRYGVQWTRGLRRLVDDGALFTQAAYPYFTTVTCAGHATIGTGAFPMTHGQIQNTWFDRGTEKDVACTDDASVKPVSYGAEAPAGTIGNSAARMLAPTFADELRGQATHAPRIVSLSMKPRSAIGLAGHAGDVVLWYDTGKGWASSTAYTTGKNPLVERFVAASPIDRDLTTPWTKLLPERAYFFEDDGLAENPEKGWTNRFPHAFLAQAGTQPDADAFERWENSPLADVYLGHMAVALVDGMKLGQSGAGTDVLAIGFSALDRVGHAFGPRSHEVQDTLARLDRTIGDLLAALDARVGRGNYVVALSADHGVAPIPEQMAKMHIDAGRTDIRGLTTKLTQVLAEKLGPGKHLAKITMPYAYLAPGVYEKLKAKPESLQAVIDAIDSMPGVARVLTRDQLEKGVQSDDAIVRAARLSYYPSRSGELLIVQKPYWLGGAAGTSHGTPYAYDQRVPVLLFGAGVKPGKYWQAATPADIAPTLAALCGVTMSRSDGRVLSEALAPSSKPARPAPRAGTSATTGTRH